MSEGRELGAMWGQGVDLFTNANVGRETLVFTSLVHSKFPVRE